MVQTHAAGPKHPTDPQDGVLSPSPIHLAHDECWECYLNGPAVGHHYSKHLEYRTERGLLPWALRLPLIQDHRTSWQKACMKDVTLTWLKRPSQRYPGQQQASETPTQCLVPCRSMGVHRSWSPLETHSTLGHREHRWL